MFQVLESRGDKDPDDVRSELSSVSHWWFDTVETTPMLWSFIRGEDDVDKAEYFIHRSKSASLAFEFHSKEATQQDVEDFINLALEYVPRWRSFRISCPSLYPMSWHFPRTAAPLLEEFTISSNGYGGMHIENLFDGNAPRLRVLSIIPHTIPWDSPILSGLSDTRIVDGEGERGDWGNRYHRLFSSSPMLEHVVIKQAGRPKSSPGPGALFNLEPVILSKLKSMELIDLPPRITTTVLSFLRRPVGYSSLIKANITSSDPDVVDLLLKSPPDALVPSMINHLTTLEIRGSKSTTFTRGYLRLHGRLSLTDLSVNESEYPGLYLDFSPPFTSRLFNFAMRFFTTSLVSLTIDGDIDIGEDTSDLARHLPLLQSLQELTLRRCKNQSVLHSIFTALQEPLPGNSEGHRSWPCPRLKKLLLIRLAFQIKKILELVETRYKLTPSSQGERPDPLQELDIRWDHSERTDKETIKKIEDIINEQNGLFSHTVGIPNY
ncbi:hypothetical protein FRC03_006405 [Tulasnella sp. 419]|nr:hypothetical protein FRC03_006405 [Tulasnella sp. 419]